MGYDSEAERIVILQIERLSQVDLTQQLNEVVRVAGLVCLGDHPPVPAGNQHPAPEVSGLGGPVPPSGGYLSGCQIPRGEGTVPGHGETEVEGAWFHRESQQVLQTNKDDRVCHPRGSEPAPGLNHTRELTV